MQERGEFTARQECVLCGAMRVNGVRHGDIFGLQLCSEACVWKGVHELHELVHCFPWEQGVEDEGTGTVLAAVSTLREELSGGVFEYLRPIAE